MEFQYRCEVQAMPIGEYTFQKVGENVHLAKNGIVKQLKCGFDAFTVLTVNSFVGEHNQQILTNALDSYWNEGTVIT